MAQNEKQALLSDSSLISCLGIKRYVKFGKGIKLASYAAVVSSIIWRDVSSTRFPLLNTLV